MGNNCFLEGRHLERVPSMVAGPILFLRVYIPVGNTLGPTVKQNLNSYEEKEDKTKEEPDGHRSENCFAAPRVTS